MQLLQEVEILAGVLKEEGVKKGDVVLVYSTKLCRLRAYNRAETTLINA